MNTPIVAIDSPEADAARFAFWFSPSNKGVHGWCSSAYEEGLEKHEDLNWWRGYVDRLMNKSHDC